MSAILLLLIGILELAIACFVCCTKRKGKSYTDVVLPAGWCSPTNSELTAECAEKVNAGKHNGTTVEDTNGMEHDCIIVASSSKGHMKSNCLYYNDGAEVFENEHRVEETAQERRDTQQPLTHREAEEEGKPAEYTYTVVGLFTTMHTPHTPVQGNISIPIKEPAERLYCNTSGVVPPVKEEAATCSTAEYAEPEKKAAASTEQSPHHVVFDSEAVYMQPNKTRKHPEALYTQPDKTRKGPEALYSQPDKTRKHPEALYSQPDKTRKHPEALYSQPDKTRKHPEVLYTQPDKTRNDKDKRKKIAPDTPHPVLPGGSEHDDAVHLSPHLAQMPQITPLDPERLYTLPNKVQKAHVVHRNMLGVTMKQCRDSEGVESGFTGAETSMLSQLATDAKKKQAHNMDPFPSAPRYQSLTVDYKPNVYTV